MAQELTALRLVIEDLERAVWGNSVWPCLRGFAAQVGFSHLLALREVMHVDHFVALRVLDSDGVAAPLRSEILTTLGDRHPIARQMRLSHEPFLMSELSDFPDNAGSCLIDTFSSQFEGTSVLVVPLVGRHGRTEAYFAFGGKAPDTDPMTRLLLQVACYAALCQSSSSPARQNGNGKSDLTPREAACLQMSSTGKTDAEISASLGIGQRTIRQHLVSAQRKLGMPTRDDMRRRKAVKRGVFAGALDD